MKVFNLVQMLLVTQIDARSSTLQLMLRPRLRAVPGTKKPSDGLQFVVEQDYIKSQLIQLNQADREAVEVYYFPRIARKF